MKTTLNMCLAGGLGASAGLCIEHHEYGWAGGCAVQALWFLAMAVISQIKEGK